MGDCRTENKQGRFNACSIFNWDIKSKIFVCTVRFRFTMIHYRNR